jgi:hypothetical protein
LYCPETDARCISTADEGFWYSVRAKEGILNNYRAELEKTFDDDGNPLGFARLRFRVYGLKVNNPDGSRAQYRIDHPYGSVTLSTNKSDPLHSKDSSFGSINVTQDTGVCADPCDWTKVGAAFVGQLKGTAGVLTQANRVPGAIGNIDVPGTVTGGLRTSVVVTRVGTTTPLVTVKEFAVQGITAP